MAIDDLIANLDPDSLSLEEQAELGLLANKLNIGQIVTLWTNDLHKQDALIKILRDSGISEQGKVDISFSQAHKVFVLDDGCSALIHKGNLKQWLINNNQWPLDKNCLLANWWAGDTETKKNKSQRQEEYILSAINNLSFNPVLIPDGGKAKIKSICEKNELFKRKTSFNTAWERLRKTSPASVQMENQDKYHQNL